MTDKFLLKDGGTLYYLRQGEGMGGFLTPPTHPTHDHCIVEKRGGHVAGISSIEYVAHSDNFPAVVRATCKGIIARWERTKPRLHIRAICEWRRSVLTYFRNCYNEVPEDATRWNAQSLSIKSDWDPMEHVPEHAGVHWIRVYYPDYAPTRAEFGAK